MICFAVMVACLFEDSSIHECIVFQTVQDITALEFSCLSVVSMHICFGVSACFHFLVDAKSF